MANESQVIRDSVGERLRVELQRAQRTLTEAERVADPAERYSRAHLAALRVAAVVMSVRTAERLGDRGRGPRNAWVVLSEVAPELAEWAAFFAATEPKRNAIDDGARYTVSTREADDLVRDAAAFLAVVCRRLPVAAATA